MVNVNKKQPSGIDILNILKTQKEDRLQALQLKGGVLIRRRQVSTNRPAIARLEILLSHPEQIPQLKEVFQRWSQKHLTQPTELKSLSEREYHVILSPHKYMYSRAEDLIKMLRMFEVEVEGVWEKWSRN